MEAINGVCIKRYLYLVPAMKVDVGMMAFAFGQFPHPVHKMKGLCKVGKTPFSDNFSFSELPSLHGRQISLYFFWGQRVYAAFTRNALFMLKLLLGFHIYVSFCFKISCTIWGLALPLLSFITWPIKYLRA